MKHILTSLLIAFMVQLNAQNFTVRAFWPDGSLVQIPLTLNVEYEGAQGLHISDEFTDGTYNAFLAPVLPAFDSVRFYLTGETDPRSGVSTIDLAALTKHLLGIKPFTTYLQLLAADVNNSESLSALDIVEIRKLILGVYQTWPSNHTLKFVLKTAALPPPINTSDIKNSKAFALPVTEPLNVDFWVVKVGDIR